MSCKKCKKDKDIVNKFHGLCFQCNNKRLESLKKPKLYKHTKQKSKDTTDSPKRFRRSVKGNKSDKIVYGGDKRSKSLVTKVMDEMFYEKCFNECTNHSCEECGESLPTEFRGDDGKVLYRARYSHIIAKSIAPELRHDVKNINHLCLKHHMQWEFGDKENMKIYKANKERFPKYFK